MFLPSNPSLAHTELNCYCADNCWSDVYIHAAISLGIFSLVFLWITDWTLVSLQLDSAVNDSQGHLLVHKLGAVVS